MINLKELLELPEQELDGLFEVLDFGNLDEPFDPKEIEFSVDDYKYRCEFALGPSQKNPDDKILEFEFLVIDGPNNPKKTDYQNDIQHAVAVRHWGIGVIGVKHPLKALKNALQSMLRYIRSYNPKHITFSADEENRQRVYKKFFVHYGHLIPQYRMCAKNPDTGEELNPQEFWLERMQ